MQSRMCIEHLLCAGRCSSELAGRGCCRREWEMDSKHREVGTVP